MFVNILSYMFTLHRIAGTTWTACLCNGKVLLSVHLCTAKLSVLFLLRRFETREHFFHFKGIKIININHRGKSSVIHLRTHSYFYFVFNNQKKLATNMHKWILSFSFLPLWCAEMWELYCHFEFCRIQQTREMQSFLNLPSSIDFSILSNSKAISSSPFVEWWCSRLIKVHHFHVTQCKVTELRFPRYLSFNFDSFGTRERSS